VQAIADAEAETSAVAAIFASGLLQAAAAEEAWAEFTNSGDFEVLANA
jgi:hypothetical protein